MKKIGLLSDTHGFLDPRIFHYFDSCDEIWHAGDIGTSVVSDQLADFRPLRAVYGNVDGGQLRQSYPEELLFTLEGVRVWITHIGGYPPRYTTKIHTRLNELQPRLFVCGHSHILRVIGDPERRLLHLNPGAAGKQGFHKVRTLLRFALDEGEIKDMEVIELGKR